MDDIYSGREQTQAKHSILKNYLQALAFKILNFYDMTYVDGFSGPWETKTDDFSDSSFMIAIKSLRDAQESIEKNKGIRRRIRCFLCESNAKAYPQLETSVKVFHEPDKKFEIQTYHGKFENAVSQIQEFIGGSFPLIFIDPTGWTGYPLKDIKPLLVLPRCEVLINFMFDFLNRFKGSDDEATKTSIDKILGTDWRGFLDQNAPIKDNKTLEKVFCEALRSEGNFEFVVSAEIKRATKNRTHFFIVYGSKNIEGLKEFKNIEHRVLRAYAKNRVIAHDNKSHMSDLFLQDKIERQENSIDEIVHKDKERASNALLEILRDKQVLSFEEVVKWALQGYMLRETNVKDICLELARGGKIKNTWKAMNKKKPYDRCAITLVHDST